MKLAEALLIRSDLQKQLAQIKARLKNNVRVQEGDTPNEDPETLIIKANQLIDELTSLIKRIHQTNVSAKTQTKQSLSTLLVQKEALQMRHKLLTDAIEATRQEEDRYSYREIKWQTTVSVANLQKQADDIAANIRQLNLTIQSNNWLIDLVE